MPQSPSDATRFTSTGPVASTMSSSSTAPRSTRIDFGQAPPNESPQQKIARLRAAAAATRRGQEDTFDKVVRVGRRWADRAHKVTMLTLLGLTVVSILFATAGITDMVLHNRRRRNDWYAEQDLKRKVDIMEAQKALSGGTISQDQLLLLAQVRAKEEAAEAKKNRPGVVKQVSSYVFGGLSTEEQKGGRLGAASSPKDVIARVAAEAKAIVEPAEEKVANITSQITQPVRTATAGGYLDRQAQQAYDKAVQQRESWQNWLLRR